MSDETDDAFQTLWPDLHRSEKVLGDEVVAQPTAPRLTMFVLSISATHLQFYVRVAEELQLHLREFKSVAAMCDLITDDLAMLLMDADAIDPQHLDLLCSRLDEQPVWSDIPVLLTTSAEKPFNELVMALQACSNVTRVFRPLDVARFREIAEAKVRDRTRQFAVQNLLRERDRQARKLEENERHLRAITDNVPAMIVFIDKDERFRFANQQYLQRRGLTQEEALSMSIREVVGEDAYDRAQPYFKRAFAGESVQFEFRTEYQGQTLDVEVNYIPHTSRSGEVTGIYATLSDITERKRIERRQQREMEVDHFLAEAGKVLVSSLDYAATLQEVARLCVSTLADWAIIDLVNKKQRVERIAVAGPTDAGSETKEAIAGVVPPNQWWRALPQESAEADIEEPDLGDDSDLEQRDGHHNNRRIADGFWDPLLSPSKLEAIADASQLGAALMALAPQSVLVVPMTAREVLVGSLTLFVCDPARRLLERDVRLAQEVARRAAIAVDNARLYESAMRADAAKSEFLASVSHELRTPLTAVLGYAELIVAESDDENVRSRVETIRANGKHLLALLNDILDLSKVEARKIDIASEQVDVVDLLTDVISIMQYRADERSLTFGLTIETEIPQYIWSDRLRLRQIILNLVSNALKFTDSGQVDMYVRVDESQSAPNLEIEVADTGIGISETDLEELFQPFTQFAGMERSAGGTGLGLSVSKRLIEFLGGDLSAKSQLGVGSRFIVRLPLSAKASERIVSPAVKHLEAAPVATHEIRMADLSGLKILVADDCDAIRFLPETILTRQGAEVVAVENGKEAVEHVNEAIANQRPFDVILMDMQMPIMTGREAVQTLVQSGCTTPIIALTAEAMSGDAEEFQSLGCAAHVPKPFNGPQIVEMIARMVGRSTATGK